MTGMSDTTEFWKDKNEWAEKMATRNGKTVVEPIN
jgi:hypothetical protein